MIRGLILLILYIVRKSKADQRCNQVSDKKSDSGTVNEHSLKPTDYIND